MTICTCTCTIICTTVVIAEDYTRARELALEECNYDTADHYECNCDCD